MTRKLLIVTGYAELGDVLQDRFQSMGLNVLLSPLDLAAQRIPQWGRPDAVLWDLPGEEARTGEVDELLRALEALAPRPALLFLLPEHAPDWPRRGEVDLFLRRPVDFETVVDSVEQLLERDHGKGGATEQAAITPFAAEAVMATPGRAHLGRQAVRVVSLDLAGARIEGPVEFPKGSLLHLHFKVPGESAPLRLEAEVTSSQRTSDRAEAVCLFKAVAYADLARLERVLAGALPS